MRQCDLSPDANKSYGGRLILNEEWIMGWLTTTKSKVLFAASILISVSTTIYFGLSTFQAMVFGALIGFTGSAIDIATD